MVDSRIFVHRNDIIVDSKVTLAKWPKKSTVIFNQFYCHGKQKIMIKWILIYYASMITGSKGYLGKFDLKKKTSFPLTSSKPRF